MNLYGEYNNYAITRFNNFGKIDIYLGGKTLINKAKITWHDISQWMIFARYVTKEIALYLISVRYYTKLQIHVLHTLCYQFMIGTYANKNIETTGDSSQYDST